MALHRYDNTARKALEDYDNNVAAGDDPQEEYRILQQTVENAKSMYYSEAGPDAPEPHDPLATDTGSIDSTIEQLNQPPGMPNIGATTPPEPPPSGPTTPPEPPASPTSAPSADPVDAQISQFLLSQGVPQSNLQEALAAVKSNPQAMQEALAAIQGR
jgi:hypothetical protein